jgi:hypothetical protein
VAAPGLKSYVLHMGTMRNFFQINTKNRNQHKKEVCSVLTSIRLNFCEGVLGNLRSKIMFFFKKSRIGTFELFESVPE